jgi:hypothetical protein
MNRITLTSLLCTLSVAAFADEHDPVAVAAVPEPSPASESARASEEGAEGASNERFSFAFSSRDVAPRDAAFGLFSDVRSLGLGGFGGRVTVFREGPWTASAGAMIEGRGETKGAARGAKVAMELDRPTARGELAYALAGFVDLVGGVGLGAEKGRFLYERATEGESASAASWVATADAALGADLHTRFGAMLLGLRLEGGYLASGAHGLRFTLPEVGDVVRQPIDLGTLRTSGPFTRFALQVGY